MYGLHGRVQRIHNIGEISRNALNYRCEEIFDGIEVLRTTLYHSLYIGTN
jgi:hypothetical protein